MQPRVNYHLAAWLGCALHALGCNKLSDNECLTLRSQAFDVINSPHLCADDSECVPTTWPECPRPVNAKNKTKVSELKDKFDKGKCEEPKPSCRDTPEIYCKQGLCVYRELAGQTNPKK
jgi:hypothetical protein